MGAELGNRRPMNCRCGRHRRHLPSGPEQATVSTRRAVWLQPHRLSRAPTIRRQDSPVPSGRRLIHGYWGSVPRYWGLCRFGARRRLSSAEAMLPAGAVNEWPVLQRGPPGGRWRSAASLRSEYAMEGVGGDSGRGALRCWCEREPLWPINHKRVRSYSIPSWCSTVRRY